ncbi:WD40-repeat-containing domain protein, partial [Mycotypha africana]|uniref:WD40-repeat-containing domain protein n=1 Tax=Mycotypha africana TaxID=64632 RepID=UPI0023007083
PYEILLLILSFLDLHSLLQASLVSTEWYVLCKEQCLWKNLFEKSDWTYDQVEMYNYLQQQQQPSNQVNQHPPYIDWQQLYKNRYAIEQRWLTGSCKIEHFPGNDCPPSELHTEGIYCVQFDKEKMITGSRDHTIKIWNIATGRCQQTLRGHSGSVLCLQYDNQHIVSGSSDATVLVSRITTGRIERKLIGHEDSVLGLRLISDDRIISCSKDRTLRIWNRITGKCLRVLNDHRAAVNSVQFRGNIAVSASGDRTIKIWDLETGECLRTLSSHTRGVACVEYDGIHIVSGSSDQTIKVWNADTGECLYTLCGHTELVRTIQLDTTTNRIISGCYNGHIKLWDLKRGKLLRDLGQATDGRVLNTKFDCTKIVCTSNLTRVIIYDFAHGIDRKFLL